VPRLYEFYPGICLTAEEKAWKNHSQGKENLSLVKKNPQSECWNITDTARIWRLGVYICCFQCSIGILAAEDGGDVDTVVALLLVTQDTDINRTLITQDTDINRTLITRDTDINRTLITGH
jgi:hypothetical protein